MTLLNREDSTKLASPPVNSTEQESGAAVKQIHKHPAVTVAPFTINMYQSPTMTTVFSIQPESIWDSSKKYHNFTSMSSFINYSEALSLSCPISDFVV